MILCSYIFTWEWGGGTYDFWSVGQARDLDPGTGGINPGEECVNLLFGKIFAENCTP